MVPDDDLVLLSQPGERLSPFLLLLHYSRGVFPFLRHNLRSMWWSPNPRSVLTPSTLHVSKSLRKTLRRGHFRVTSDVAFHRVVRSCRHVRRGRSEGIDSWIDDEIEEVFSVLHRFGHAHSVETWRDGELVGGLYGVAVGQVFVGCSMFHTERDASKVALVRLVEEIPKLGISMIDCQLHNPHLQRLGARLIPRQQFVENVAKLARGRRALGLWTEAFGDDAPGFGV